MDEEIRSFIKKEGDFIRQQVETAFLYVIENLLKSICERESEDLPKGIVRSKSRAVDPVLSRNILLQGMEASFIDVMHEIRKDETKFIKYFKD